MRNYNNNLGLGITAPTAKLHVVGTAQITGNTTITGNLVVSGTISGSGVALPLNCYSAQLDAITAYAVGALLRYSAGTVVNPNTFFDAPTVLFTVPYTGYVEVSASACINGGSAGSMTVYVRRSGAASDSIFLFSTATGYGNQTGSGSCIYSCVAGDKLSINANNAFTAFGGYGGCTYKMR